MADEAQPTCRIVRPGETYEGKQGFSYCAGISRESVGATGICLHLLTIPPGQRAKAHLHSAHETAIYALSGETEMWWGDRLQHRLVLRAGEMLYIPAGMPHRPANVSDQPASAIIARTDPNEQESVVLLPELEALLPSGG